MPIRDYFLFTNKEKRGLSVLLIILLLSIFIPVLYGSVLLKRPEPVVLKPIKGIADTSPVQTTEDGVESSPTYFSFDPNTLDSVGWISLGFTPAQVSGVLKYRSKGGKFKYRDDLLKLYFIDKETYLSLRPYISLDAFPSRTYSSKNTRAPIPVVDINQANKEEWMALPGIGEVLSDRIIAYRDRVGGFDSVSQLLSVYGLKQEWMDDFSEQLIVGPKPERTAVNPAPARPAISIININVADSAQLDALPGIGPTMARRILEYRNSLGGFVDTAQLQEVYGMRPENLQKAMPYITITTQPNKLSLSSASQESLAKHPYIGKSLAAFIVSYRLRHGKFESVDELSKSYLVNPALLEKLRPYLEP